MASYQLRAGIESARLDIDPPVELVGYPTERVASDTHDPLSVKSLVLSDGSVTIGIASIDILGVSREMRTSVLARLADNEVPLDHVMLAATHTHAGPNLPIRAISAKPRHGDKEVDGKVVEEIERKTAETLEAAYTNREPAELQLGSARTTAASENRRKEGPMSSGTRVPHGEIDPAVDVLRVTTESADELVLFNFACHPVCSTPSETLLSADWPGTVYDTVGDETGAVTMYLNGAAGDINPRNWASDREGEEVYAFMRDIGETVAGAVLDAYRGARDAPPFAGPISATRRDVRFPLKSIPEREALDGLRSDLQGEIDRLESEGNDELASIKRTDLTYIEELIALSEWGCRRYPATMQYFEVGPLGVLGMPGEVLVQHGLDFRSGASADALMPVGYADGYVGYVPTLESLERIGYEVQTSIIAPESIGKFRQACFDMIR